MGMKDNPGSGYVVELDTVLSLMVAPEDKLLIEKWPDDYDPDKLCSFLGEIFPIGTPKPAHVFMFGEEDTSDDLETGKWYVVFDEDDLYKKTEKAALKTLHQMGVKPELFHWAIWG